MAEYVRLELQRSAQAELPEADEGEPVCIQLARMLCGRRRSIVLRLLRCHGD